MLAIFKKETSVNITLCNSTVSDIPLHFQGNTIESSGSLKLLGVTTDDQLNFNIHINEICKTEGESKGRSNDEA